MTDAEGKKPWKKVHSLDNDLTACYHWEVPFRVWRVLEWMTTILVLYTLFWKVNRKNYDAVNFHIAYPLCTHLHLFRRWIGKPVVITEHWSAYHFSFHVKDTDKLWRIRRIFRRGHDLDFITVSESLKNDLEQFAGTSLSRGHIVPNVVDTRSFYLKEGARRSGRFFMVGNWRYPKDPALAIKAFQDLFGEEGRRQVELRIGGYGPLYDDLKDFSAGEHINLCFLGKLDRATVAAEMQAAEAFVHCSAYETFSVVCAEALCCGTPVITSARGGVREFVHEGNGILVGDNDPASWKKALLHYEKNQRRLKEKERAIADEAQGRFSPDQVGLQYHQALIKAKNSRL